MTAPGTQGQRRGRAAFAPDIALVLACFLLLSALWAFTIPVFHVGHGGSNPLQPHLLPFSGYNPDEPSHIAVVDYIAREGALPPYTLRYYESAHPPLYHIAAAVLYRLAYPVLGLAGTIRFLRLFGAVCGAGVVWFTWRIAERVLPRRSSALLAAALAAGVPLFPSLSASISNEILSALAAAGALAALCAGALSGAFDRKTLLAVAFWTAVGVGSKVTCLGLLPLAIGTIGWIGWRRGVPVRRIAAQIVVVLLVSGLLSGWWYLRNITLYGDPLRQTVSERLWETRIPGYAALAAQGQTSALRYFARLTFWGWAGFWGIFDAFQRPLPAGVYVALAAFQTVAAVGLWRLLRRRFRRIACVTMLTAPFAAWVALVYYRYTWSHYTPQGRFFYPLLLPFAILTAAGWWWVSLGVGRGKGRLRMAWRGDYWAAGILLVLNLCVFAREAKMVQAVKVAFALPGEGKGRG